MISIWIINSGSIDGRAGLAVVRPQLLANAAEVHKTVDQPHHVTVGHVRLEAEALKQRPLCHPPLTHYQPTSNCLMQLNQDFRRTSSPSFSTQSGRKQTPSISAHICAPQKQTGAGAGLCSPEALLSSNSGMRRPFLNPSSAAAISTAMNLMAISFPQQGRDNAAVLVCAVGSRVG